MVSKWNALKLRQHKRDLNEKSITMVTVYDASMSRLAARSNCDVLLVGDSLGMVLQGHDDTLSVTMEHMVYHTESVRRGAPDSFVVVDMPFGSYQTTIADGIKNAIKLVQAGANMVKVEGAAWVPLIQRTVETGIPVMGHLGLTPQSVHQLGGYRVQGRGAEEAQSIVTQAVALEEAGCSSIVLESMPSHLAQEITQKVSIPTIGIGAGAHTDGQVLVWHDIFGLNLDFKPKFAKQYATLESTIIKALNRYCDEVQQRVFPNQEHMYH